MNEGLTKFLNRYAESNAPGYAVLLKGAWGSGKSYFIRNWMQSLKEDTPETEEDVVLKPIYVSLYGRKSASEIQDAIRMELYPRLNSKSAKTIKTIITGLTKITLGEEKLEGALDILSIFKNQDKLIKGHRLLIFDDLERASMDAREAMGCINYYVELCGCKVIIISNEDKITDSKYFEIKEKTVGREFEIAPDIDSALDTFLHGPDGIGCDEINRLEELKPFTKDVFFAAGTNNLRVLRQALMDFDAIVRDFESHYQYKNKRQYLENLRLLLGNMLAIYLEYKSGNRVLEDWKNAVMKKPEGQPDPTTFRRKYNPIGEQSGSLFRMDWVEQIMRYLKCGAFDLTFLQGLFVRKSTSSWAQLDNFLSLESDEFNTLVDTAWKSLKGRKITDIREVYHAAYNLLRILREELPAPFNEEDIIEQTDKYFQRDLEQIVDEQSLMEYRRKVHDRIRYYQDPPVQAPLDEIAKRFHLLFQKRAGEVKNPLAIALENVTDATIPQIEALLDSPVPNGSCLYNDSPILAAVNPQTFARSVEKMSNTGRQELQAVLQKHYRSCLQIGNPAAFIQRYYDDAIILRQAADEMEGTISSATGLNRANLRRFQRTLIGFAYKLEDIEFTRAQLAGEKDIIAATVDEPFTRFTETAGLVDYETIYDLWQVTNGGKARSNRFRFKDDMDTSEGKWLEALDTSARLHLTPAIAEYFPIWLERRYMKGMDGESWYQKQVEEANRA